VLGKYSSPASSRWVKSCSLVVLRLVSPLTTRTVSLTQNTCLLPNQQVRVVPKYFEHAKFSSFIRQANGWGFRRITTGRDRNAYYHPRFLRGLPHLCKEMKRPGVSEKMAADPDHEPDLAKISEQFPVPLRPTNEQSTLLHCTLHGGPKARMPVQALSMIANNDTLPPRDQETMASFSNSLGAVEQQRVPTVHFKGAAPIQQQQQQTSSPAFPMMMMPGGSNQGHILAAANQMAWNPSGPGVSPHMFAAGFAAAMAQTFAQQQQQHPQQAQEQQQEQQQH